MVLLGFHMSICFPKDTMLEDIGNLLCKTEDHFTIGKYSGKVVVDPVVENRDKGMIVIPVSFSYHIPDLYECEMKAPQFQHAFEHLALLISSVFICFPQLCMVTDFYLLCNGTQYRMNEETHIYWPGDYSLTSDCEMTWQQTLNWILVAANDGRLTYLPLFIHSLFSKSYGQLHAAVSALEKIYVPEGKVIKQRLQTRIPAVISNANSDTIKGMYTCRSEYVHGNIVPTYMYIQDCEKSNSDVLKYAEYAMSLLRETLRLLINKNATAIKFDEHVNATMI